MPVSVVDTDCDVDNFTKYLCIVKICRVLIPAPSNSSSLADLVAFVIMYYLQGGGQPGLEAEIEVDREGQRTRRGRRGRTAQRGYHRVARDGE